DAGEIDELSVVGVPRSSESGNLARIRAAKPVELKSAAAAGLKYDVFGTRAGDFDNPIADLGDATADNGADGNLHPTARIPGEQGGRGIDNIPAHDGRAATRRFDNRTGTDPSTDQCQHAAAGHFDK